MKTAEAADRAIIFTALLFLIGMVGAGFAFAKAPYVGQTYAKVVAKIEARNNTPVIRTVVGSQVALDDCIVTHAEKSKTAKRTWLLDLNCLNAVAGPGHPGNSVTTPEGKVAADRQDRADRWNDQIAAYQAGGKKVPWCGRNADNTTTCRDFCARHGICSTGVLQYLASLPKE